MPKVPRQKKQKIVPYVRGFKAPTQSQVEAALGSFGINSQDKTMFDTGTNFFDPLPKCTSIDDWLAQYDERGQSYSDFLFENPWLSRRPVKGTKQTFISSGQTIHEKYPEGKIYVVALGDFDGDNWPSFQAMIEYAEAFFGLPVKQLAGIPLHNDGERVHWIDQNKYENETNVEKKTRKSLIGSRYNKKCGVRQLRVGDILCKLRGYVPNDGLCLIALTKYDLYETKPDLFVAGMAAGNHRAAVFSLMRYDPNLSFSQEFWYDIRQMKSFSQEERMRLWLLRSCRLLVHETSHLLGFGHCIHYACCMNGSGHLDEDFRQPMYLCPVDLRKLYRLCGFNVIHRYEKLQNFFEKYKMLEEALWMRRRVEFLNSLKI